MSPKKGDPTTCGKCGAPAKYVFVSTFEQYQPSEIRYAVSPALTVEQLRARILAHLDASEAAADSLPDSEAVGWMLDPMERDLVAGMLAHSLIVDDGLVVGSVSPLPEET